MSLFAGEFPPLRPFQQITHEAIRKAAREGHRRILVCAPTGAGKCLGEGTLLLLADGTTTRVEWVNIGDRLMGPDGKARTVLSISSGEDMLYEVIPSKGDPYIVNSVHLLSLQRTGGSDGIRLSSGRHIPKNEAGPFFVEAEDFFLSNKTAKHCLKGWRPDSVEFESQTRIENLPIPPYILGVWLGDGLSDHPSIANVDGPVVSAWKSYARSIGCEVSQIGAPGACPIWRIKSVGRPRKTRFAKGLDELGLLRNKHIPQAYLMASREDRLQLLAGLLDTDGHLSRGGFDFAQKRHRIADGLTFLCRSLGLAAYINGSLKGIKDRNFEDLYWRVSISGDCSVIPCRIPSKRAPTRRQKKDHLRVGLEIRPIGRGRYFGFEIDGDRQFLLRDWQVTHNTIQAMNTIRETLQKGNRAMFLADRKTLIAQTSNVARDLGMGNHGIIQADNPMLDLSRPFQIASCQTLMRRGWPASEVLIIDEAHTLYKTWRDYVLSDECKAFVIGLTATPFSAGLGKYFTKLINAATMAELTECGTLVPMRIFSCRKPDMSGADVKPGGEWSDDAASKAEMAIIGDVLTEWQRLAHDRKTIVFGPTIAYCNELAKRFNDAGVPAAVFCSDTPDDERGRITSDFAYGSIRVLISVEALAKGFDQKDVGCVCDCRPLRKSLSTAIQMWGRGLRSSPETGKEDCILLDFSGNIIRFWDDFEDVFHNGVDKLDDGEKLDKKVREDKDEAPRCCPKCGHSPFGRKCIQCGHEVVPKDLCPELPGQMQEIRIGKKVLAHDKADLWAQVATYARDHARAGKDPNKKALAIFKNITGEWPPRSWTVYNAPEVAPSAATLGKIRSLNIAFIKGRAAHQGAA